MTETYNTKLIKYQNSICVKKYSKGIRTNYSLSADDINNRRRKEDSERTQQEIDRSIEVSRNRTINTVYSYALSNTFDWFYTFTFNPDKIDSYDYSACTAALKSWIDDMRKKYAPDIKYIVVPELHKSGRFHFHGMFANVDSVPLTYSKKGSTKSTAVYNLPTYDYGFTTATLIRDSDCTCSYVLKYITKELCAVSKNKKRYWTSRNLNKPEVFTYNLAYDDFENNLESISDDITYAKTINIPFAHNKINLYITENL